MGFTIEERIEYLEKAVESLLGRSSQSQDQLPNEKQVRAACAKLKDGTFGARVHGKGLTPGTKVIVTSKSGKSWPVKLVSCSYSCDEYSLWSTESMDRSKPDHTVLDRGISEMRNAVDKSGPPIPVDDSKEDDVQF